MNNLQHHHIAKMLVLLLALIFCFDVYSQQRLTLESKIDIAVKKYVDHYVFNGTILVADHDELIYHKSYGNAHIATGEPKDNQKNTLNKVNTQFGIGSITKTITAVMVMQLVENNDLKLEDKISQHLPNFPKEKGDRISLHQLLSHRSGLPNYFEIPGWTNGQFNKSMSVAEFENVIYRLPLKFEPGTSYEYSNSGYFLLGKIIEKVTQKNYLQALQENLLVPAKMTRTGLQLNNDKPPHLASSYQFSGKKGFRQAQINPELFRAAGDMYSTAKDLFSFEQALLGGKLLSKDSLDRLFKPGRSYGWNQLKVATANQQLDMVSYSGQLMGFNSMLSVIPKDKFTVILLGNIGTSHYERMNITHEIISLLYDMPIASDKLRASLYLHRALYQGNLTDAIQEIKSNPDEFQLDRQGIQSLAQQVGWSGLASQEKAILQLLN